MPVALGLLVCQPMASLQSGPCSPAFLVDVSAPGSTRSSTLFYPKRPVTFAGCGSRSSSVVRAVSQKDILESLSNVVTDERVPEGHQGLHGFLYGEDGADIHDSKSKEFSGRGAEDDGSSIVGFENYVDAREGYKFAGVYAAYDINATLQYVGFSRNVPLSLKTHRNRVGPDRCSAVRVKLFTDPAMITKTRLEEERQEWLSQGDVPPGNASERDLWESDAGAQSLKVMSEKERTEYEEKKLKIRKAMGENLHDAVEGEDDDARTRRMKLLQATEGDDWSSVIDGQTRDTVNQTSPAISKKEEQEEQGTELITSPFVEATPQKNRGLYSADHFEFTLKNVDMVLDDVRPYLVADGGNVEVVSIDNGVVSLRLQGACGTCPSSTVTMKMGIERVLKEKFGEAVKEVVEVDQQTSRTNVMGINAHLDILRPAINNYGGSVEVISVENGVCQIKFKGPPPIGMGIQAAIKDKFPEVTSVVLIDV